MRGTVEQDTQELLLDSLNVYLDGLQELSNTALGEASGNRDGLKEFGWDELKSRTHTFSTWTAK